MNGIVWRRGPTSVWNSFDKVSLDKVPGIRFATAENGMDALNGFTVTTEGVAI